MGVSNRKPDFSGWATKNNLRCTDGRTILPGAFKHQDQTRVPLVWQHDTTTPGNVIGTTLLHDRAFGTFAEGFFNENPQALEAKEGVRHGDIVAMSISANRLRHTSDGGVLSGNITEVSLVLNGANPGALITDVSISHSADGSASVDEAIIYTGLTLEHSDNSTEGANVPENQENEEPKGGDLTIQEIVEGMSPDQQNALYYLVGEALKGDDDAKGEEDDDEMSQSDFISGEEILQHINDTIKEGFNDMSRNTFATHGAAGPADNTRLSHAQFAEIVEIARRDKSDSLMDELRHGAGEVLNHAGEGTGGVDFGIANIEMLFPDAKALETTPDFLSRRMEWVNEVLRGTKHIPFANVKTIHADITEPEARAKGYIKGKRKKEEIFKLLKRTTGPTTIYKKQKLDRDDILDITDFNVVVWLQQEMRLMLEEEIARAILVGDGRDSLSEDKVQDPEGAIQGTGIRSILHDDELYAIPVTLPANVSPKDMVKGLIRNRHKMKGSGKPHLYISDEMLIEILLEEDKLGRPIYDSKQQLADKLNVSGITDIGLFSEYEGLVAIVVNLQDYSVGTNKGGEIVNFDTFDLNFNRHIYLMETRLSGGLTKALSAMVVTRAKGTEVVPTAPDFNTGTNTITIPTTTGVIYYINDVSVTGSVTIEEDTEVTVSAAENYYLAPGSTRSWNFTYTAE